MARRRGIAGSVPLGVPVGGGCRGVGGKVPLSAPAGRGSASRPAVRGRRSLTLRGGIGKSYASRLLGDGVMVDVTRTGEGSYSATITTQGKSMASRVLGGKVQAQVGRHTNGYHGSVGVGAKGQCFPGPQPCDGGREACSYSNHGVLTAGCRASTVLTDGGNPAPSRRPAALKRGRRGRPLTMKAGR